MIAFDHQAQTDLLRLSKGDTVTMAIGLTVSTWTNDHGDTRPSLNLTAHQVLTAYEVRRKREGIINIDN